MSWIMMLMELAVAGPPNRATVVAVYDGDTFTLNTGEKVRLRGVNTPELRPKEKFGIEARDAAKEILLNQPVWLTYGEVKEDSYGRLIASVRTKDTDIGEHLLKKGLGHVFLIPPEEVDVESYLAAQMVAKKNRDGIWSLSRYDSDFHFTSFHANAAGNDRKNVNGEYLRICNISQKEQSTGSLSIRNIKGLSFQLDDIVIPAGHTVKLHSGRGTNQSNPSRQLELYLGSNSPIWSNDHDRATLSDTSGKVHDSRLHKPKTRPKQ